ncbi:MAG: 2-hydroxyglutaryl-CoA dehydratase [Clostridia bacterium]|nr:MAG: 2-hydroxyglutaryl-CoA dehydratase [Clostridia bacterium]
MVVAGIDIGSRIAKAAIMEAGSIVSYAVLDTGLDSTQTAMKVLRLAASKAGATASDIQYIVATGYGRVLVEFADEMVSEIACHAKGVNYYFPSARTVLDVGGQDSKVINCDEKGRVVSFAMNDKCAGGTGRFLETMADLLQLPLDKMSMLSLKAAKPVPLSSHCVIYEKSEVLLKLRQGVPKYDLVAGIYESLVTRIMDLLAKVSLQEDFVFGGGVARNIGLFTKLQERLGVGAKTIPEPVIQGAVGAAVLAGERMREGHARKHQKEWNTWLTTI